MNVFGKASLLAIALSAGMSAGAGAQEVCEVEEGRPRDLGNALLSLTSASSASAPEQAVRHLQAAIKSLTDNAARIDRENAAGRNYLLGKTLVLWMQQPGIGFDATQGQLGYGSNPEQRVDLVAATDAAFDIVVAAHPQCAADIENWRMQQPWVDLVNGAIQQINVGNLDSAETLVNRSITLAEKSPFGPNLLAAIEQQRGNYPRAVELRRRTLELAEGDTSYNEIRVESLFNLAALLGHQAEQATGAEQVTLAQEAAATFQQYVTEAPQGPQAVQARAGYANMMMLAGDTTAVAGLYADQIANPSNYSDLSLVDAGVVAARAEKAEDAAKLFEAALTVNPYNRDALYNVAASYYALQKYDEMLPHIARLRDIDPANPDNLQLLALVYQGKQQTLTDPAAKKAATDSLIKYYSAMDSVPVKVSVDQFARGESQVSLSGTLENMGTAPKAFTVTVDFLDRTGTVVGSQETSVGPVAPKQATTFRVNIEQPGVAAWRYRVSN